MSRSAARSRAAVWLVDGRPGDTCTPESAFTERLAQLWDTRPGLTSAEVATALAARGGPAMSAWTIDRLRMGAAANPTLTQVEALAAFFGVPPVFLLGAAAERRLADDLQRAAGVPTAQVRELLLRISDLSPDGVTAVRRIVDRCAVLEGRAG